MSKYKDLVGAIRAASIKSGPYVFTAEVVDVNGADCKIKFQGLELSGVRIKSTLSNSNAYVLFTPKVGTIVTVIAPSGDMRDLHILKIDEAESVEVTNGDLLFKLDLNDNKMVFKNNSINIMDLFNSLAGKIDDIYNAIQAGVPVAQDGGAALKSSIIAGMTGFPVAPSVDQDVKKIFK